MGLSGLHHGLRDLAALQDLRSASCDRLEGPLEIGLHELPAEGRELAVRELDARGLREAREVRLGESEHAAVVNPDRNALAAEPTCGLHHPGPGQAPVEGVELVQSLQQAGHGDRASPQARGLRVHLARGVQKHVRGGGGGGDLARIQSQDLTRGPDVGQDEATAAEAGAELVTHAGGEARRHRSVDRVSALDQDLPSGRGRGAHARDHHTLPTPLGVGR